MLAQKKLASLGGGDPERAFSLPENLPCFQTSDGRRIPIKRVRISETVKARGIGAGYRRRLVKPGGNHHVEIFGMRGSGGQDQRWETLGVVTMMEAYERLREDPARLVQRVSEPGWEFRFSLAPGDTVECDSADGARCLLKVRAISEEEKSGAIKIEMVHVNQAGDKKDVKKSRQWITKSPNELRKWRTLKVSVSPLGNVCYAYD